jgi:hypothetical protein
VVANCLSSLSCSSPSGCPQWEAAPSRHTSSQQPGRCMQLGYTGEAEWRPEASSRGDVKQPKQPRRCAGRRTGAYRRGEDSPLARSTDLDRNRMRLAALLGDRSWTRFPPKLLLWRTSNRNSDLRTPAPTASDKEQHAGFLSRVLSLPIGGR